MPFIFPSCHHPVNTQVSTHDIAAYQALTAWYKSPLGQHLLSREQALVDEMLGRRFGYHLLQLGCADLQLHHQSPMGHKFAFTPFLRASSGHQAVAETDAIPLMTASVDCVLLHHALDYAADQHQLLREVTRVLIAGGHVVIVGFNPFSTWGVRSKLWLRNTHSPWHARMLHSLRVCDWLKLLDFQVDEIRYAEYALPINTPAVIRYSNWMEKPAAKLNWPTGAVYVIAARKQVLPLTPVQSRRRRRAVPTLALPLTEGTSRKQDLPTAAQESAK
jgi:SAM-dependent methyltransferase